MECHWKLPHHSIYLCEIVITLSTLKYYHILYRERVRTRQKAKCSRNTCLCNKYGRLIGLSQCPLRPICTLESHQCIVFSWCHFQWFVRGSITVLEMDHLPVWKKDLQMTKTEFEMLRCRAESLGLRWNKGDNIKNGESVRKWEGDHTSAAWQDRVRWKSIKRVWIEFWKGFNMAFVFPT